MKDFDINDHIKTVRSEDFIRPKHHVRMREVIDEGVIKEVIPTIEIPLEEYISNKTTEQYFMGCKHATDDILGKMVELAMAIDGKAKK